MGVTIALIFGTLVLVLPLRAAVTIRGRVVDENNVAVAGARVWGRAPSEGVGTPEEAFGSSGLTGLFTFTLPSPGLYLFSVEAIGYFPLRDRAVRVDESLGELHLVLNHQREVFESVKVRASASPVDLDKTSSQQSLKGLEILNVPFPSTHSLQNAMKLMPGVTQDSRGRVHFEGSAENQVFYTLNGFNITDPLTGTFDTHLSVEAVRSLDFSSGRYSPEFGKGSAGALAIHTETGDDQLRYSATNFVPGVDTRKRLHLGTWSPRLGISGPIVKGRAWFSETIDGLYQQLIVPDLPAGQDRNASLQISNLLHGQVNLTPANILYTDFLVNRLSAGQRGLTALDPPPTTTDVRSRTWFFSMKDQMYLAHGTLLEFGFAQNRTFNRQIPQGPDLYIIAPSGRQGNYFIDSTQKSQRDQLISNLYLPSFRLAGVHQLKAGIDLDRLNYWQDMRRTGFEAYSLGGYLLRKTTFGGSGLLNHASLEASSYLLDAWRIRPNLMLEGGVRQDWDELVRRVVFSPRLAVSYAPFGRKDMKISGGYAVIYDATTLQLFTRPQDQYSLSTAYNPDGSVLRGPAATIFTIQNAHLRAPRYENWSLGFDQQLPHRFRLQATLLRKRGQDGFTYINNFVSENSIAPSMFAAYHAVTFDGIYNLANYRRDIYDSAKFTIRQSIGEEYEWMASYSRSRALSNAVVDVSVDQPMLLTGDANNIGPMAWDTPNRILSWGYLPTWWKQWAMAYLMEIHSGLPFSIQTEDNQLAGPVNSWRFPTYFSLNLHLERRFHLRGYRFALRGGFNNITNHQNPNVVNSTVGSPDFLHYYGSEGRHFVFRLRFLGKE